MSLGGLPRSQGVHGWIRNTMWGFPQHGRAKHPTSCAKHPTSCAKHPTSCAKALDSLEQFLQNFEAISQQRGASSRPRGALGEQLGALLRPARDRQSMGDWQFEEIWRPKDKITSNCQSPVVCLSPCRTIWEYTPKVLVWGGHFRIFSDPKFEEKC